MFMFQRNFMTPREKMAELFSDAVDRCILRGFDEVEALYMAPRILAPDGESPERVLYDLWADNLLGDMEGEDENYAE